jgi:CRISPR/Cas system CMR-associated protein Cmr3 (group 5 of RAMP superfamily)
MYENNIYIIYIYTHTHINTNQYSEKLNREILGKITNLPKFFGLG